MTHVFYTYILCLLHLAPFSKTSSLLYNFPKGPTHRFPTVKAQYHFSLFIPLASQSLQYTRISQTHSRCHKAPMKSSRRGVSRNRTWHAKGPSFRATRINRWPLGILCNSVSRQTKVRPRQSSHKARKFVRDRCHARALGWTAGEGKVAKSKEWDGVCVYVCVCMCVCVCEAMVWVDSDRWHVPYLQSARRAARRQERWRTAFPDPTIPRPSGSALARRRARWVTVKSYQLPTDWVISTYFVSIRK